MKGNSVNRIGRWVLRPVLGRPWLQPFFDLLRGVAIAGMGYGEGDSPATSGERGVLRYIRSSLQGVQPVVVFDVGANIGDYAEEVLGLWAGRAALWCFEPSPSTFKKLSYRLSERDGVVLENLGLSDTCDSIPLYTCGDGSKIASVYKRSTGPWQLTQSEWIRVVTLDSYCVDHDVTAIDLLKLDVEGHELSVLRGAEGLLRRRAVRFIQFEFSAASIDSRVFFRDYFDLLNPTHDLYRVLAHGFAPVKRYEVTQEVFDHATNYLAVRRPVAQ